MGGTQVGKREVTPAVRDMLEKMVAQVMARCDREGIAWADFYEAMLVEMEVLPKVPVEEVFRRTFVRLRAQAN